MSLVLSLLMFWTFAARTGEVFLEMPGEIYIAKAGMNPGKVNGSEVRFALPPTGRMSAEITLKDGRQLIGVDMGWLREMPPGEGELESEDIEEIRRIARVPGMFDRIEITRISGDSDRATAMVELVRDREFHNARGDAIWRVELWYFEFANGAWVRVGQQSRILDRQRFKTTAEFRAYLATLRFVPAMGGITLPEGELTLRLRITEDDFLKPVFRP
jgi:hypothetical protein